MAKKKEAFKRLKALGDEKVSTIDKLLCEGRPASEVATLVQEEWGDLTEIGHVSVKKMLERYRKSELRQKLIERATGQTRNVQASVLSKRISAMEEMTTLVEIQKSRFLKAYGKEVDMPGGLLLSQVSAEARLLKEFLVELGRLQLETGALRRAPKTFSGTVTDEDGVTRAFEWSEEQEHLYKQLDDVGYKRIN